MSASVCLPPLEYEASAELQEELEAAAPNEFICPIGRYEFMPFCAPAPCAVGYMPPNL